MSKIYNTIIFSIVLLVWIVVFTILYRNEPLNGDLTRIGGYREAEFGWNNPREEFEKDLFHVAQHIDEYDQYYDVVVLGDSFTLYSEKIAWVNYFIEKTGYSVLAIHFDHTDIHTLLASPQFTATPPRMLIYQSVERSLVEHLLREGRVASRVVNDHDIQNPAPALSFQPIKTVKQMVNRKRTWDDIERGFSDTVSYIQRALMKDENADMALLLDMKDTARGVFSSVNQHGLLITREDISRKAFSDDKITEAAVILHDIHHAVSSNGKTHFSLLVFPDKLSIYEEFLEDQSWGGLSILSKLNRHYGLLRLDRYFKEAVHINTIDLYMPNNTHTSSIGNKIAAEKLLEFLEHNPGCQGSDSE